jgi:hypothetical protein
LYAMATNRSHTIHVRISPAELEAWTNAAHKDSRKLSDWLRLVVTHAATNGHNVTQDTSVGSDEADQRPQTLEGDGATREGVRREGPLLMSPSKAATQVTPRFGTKLKAAGK